MREWERVSDGLEGEGVTDVPSSDSDNKVCSTSFLLAPFGGGFLRDEAEPIWTFLGVTMLPSPVYLLTESKRANACKADDRLEASSVNFC